MNEKKVFLASENKKTAILIPLIGIFLLLVLSIPLLGSDSKVFLIWWLMVLTFGIGFYPMSRLLFASFTDGGWIFSKSIGIAICGLVMWFLATAFKVPFNRTISTVIFIAAFAICMLFLGRKASAMEAPSLSLILWEELIFVLLFLIWTYFAGFHPAASGTEKFMDYGFMATMMRSDAVPAPDLWHSGDAINYYYGGQYFAVFLTKLSGTRINETYNLMRTLVAGFSFAMPFSLVYQMLSGKKDGRAFGKKRSAMGALVAGAGVSLAGNMHYVLYGLFGNVFQLSGYEDYWFPSSTRYIGHNPATDDACIHEFPSYSFVLGDLHAHVVNLLFVMVIIALMYAWMQESRRRKRPVIPHLLLSSILVGMFHFTNYWDYVIYFTVMCFCIVAVNLYLYRKKVRRMLLTMGIEIAACFAVITIVALPFTATFEVMFSGVAVAKNHSAFYQLLVLWGLPAAGVILFFAILFLLTRQKKADISLSDCFVALIGLCALGLILIPELVYVRDIYENGYARSNTMFKLTYQAYVMFGIAFPYIIFRLLDMKKRAAQVAGGIFLTLYLLTFGYFGYSVHCWFGNVFDHSGYQGLDAEAFIETSYPDDASAIRYLESELDSEGSPVVLEAWGNSYSENCRVSAMTGLPTILGWYTHEWLWRSNPDELAIRYEAVNTIYTTEDKDLALSLLEDYDVEYIFVGSCERETYENLNEDILQSLGQIVYQGEDADGDGFASYIIKVED